MHAWYRGVGVLGDRSGQWSLIGSRSAVSVVEFKIKRREPYAEGREFGDVGAYERIDARAGYAVDPLHPTSAGIVDLELAPRDPSGRVRFEGDVVLIVPRDPARGNGRLLLDVPNRGRTLAVSTFNRSGGNPMQDPLAAGDGFLFRRGYSVASVAWQADAGMVEDPLLLHPPFAQLQGKPVRGPVCVELRPSQRVRSAPLSQLFSRPYPVADLDDPSAVLLVREWEDGPDTEIPRSEWRFARETERGLEASDRHLFLEEGLRPGQIYYLVYTTEGSPVVGTGLLALRDAAVFLRAGGSQSPCPEGFPWVYGFGASQTGRLLRHFLQLGLNLDEESRLAFDGLLAHIAGAVRGEFNQRFAQPSVAHTPGFGQRFPFADLPTRDPHGDTSAGLLDRLGERNVVPKTFYTNSSFEYWRGDASLIHIGSAESRDLLPHPNTRIYHFAGTQHVNGTLPQSRELLGTGERSRYGLNVVDFSPLLRAALIRLDRWTSQGAEPPPSRYPRLDDGTAVERAAVLEKFRALPELAPPDPQRLSVVRTVDLGPEAERGVGRYPAREGAAYACYVSEVDADLNEISGVRLPDVSVPVGTHTGWNARGPEVGAPELAAKFVGLTRFFAPSRSVRESSADPRKALDERYASRDAYLDQVRKAAVALADQGYVLDEDVDLVVDNCAERYDAAREAAPPSR